jgi:hypothetical protein
MLLAAELPDLQRLEVHMKGQIEYYAYGIAKRTIDTDILFAGINSGTKAASRLRIDRSLYLEDALCEEQAL